MSTVLQALLCGKRCSSWSTYMILFRLDNNYLRGITQKKELINMSNNKLFKRHHKTNIKILHIIIWTSAHSPRPTITASRVLSVPKRNWVKMSLTLKLLTVSNIYIQETLQMYEMCQILFSIKRILQFNAWDSVETVFRP